jgi:hypothetical protein
MAIIYSYPKVTSPLATDVLILTDTTLTAGKRKNKTKSLALSDLASYVVSSTSGITGGGTLNTIPLWTPDGFKLGDSIIVQSTTQVGVDPTIQVGTYSGPGQQTVLGAGFISTSGIGADQGSFTNITSGQTGVVTIRGNAIIGDQATDTLIVNSTVTINNQLIDGTGSPGTAGQVLSSTGAQTEWIDSSASALTAESIVQPIIADGALVKGDPVYITGFNNGQNKNIVAKADSSDPAKMPVVGISDGAYANNGAGFMTAFGSFNGAFDTTGGAENWSVGDIIYVKPGGGLTNIKPGGTDLVQNIAIVSRVQQNTGELEVIALGRTNDVPNLPTGRLFVGTATNTSLASDVIYVDDTNDNVGIGTTIPNAASTLHLVDTSPQLRLQHAGNTGYARVSTISTNALRFGAGSSGQTRMSILGSNGNVGIGTTGPNRDLHVIGQVAIDNSTSPSGGLLVSPDGSSNKVYSRTGNATESAHPLDFISGSSTSMRIDTGGNVGIGTTSPAQKLTVEGNTTSQYVANFRNTGTTGRGLIVRTDSDAVGGDILSLFSGSSYKFWFGRDGRLGLGSANPQSKIEVNGGDVEVKGSTNGIILESPDGTRYRVTVANGGTLSVAAV